MLVSKGANLFDYLCKIVLVKFMVFGNNEANNNRRVACDKTMMADNYWQRLFNSIKFMELTFANSCLLSLFYRKLKIYTCGENMATVLLLFTP